MAIKTLGFRQQWVLNIRYMLKVGGNTGIFFYLMEKIISDTSAKIKNLEMSFI